MTDLSAAMIVGDQLRHRWSAARIAADPRVELLGLVSERHPPTPRGRDAAEDALVADHFAERARAEERHFGSAPAWEALGPPVLAVEPGAVNMPFVDEWIRELGPRYLVLYGCAVLRALLLDRFRGRVVNLHLGLSPYYRGHATNFWPLVNGEPECVGATVHIATSDVDAGPVLRQVRPEIAPDDGPHDIGCKALAAGVDALLHSLPRFADGALEPVPQRGDGRLYRRADFDSAPGDALRELRSRFARGMIPEYLAERRRRDACFPIVE